MVATQSVSEQITRAFVKEERYFTLLNCTPQPIQIVFEAETRIVPAAGDVAMPHPRQHEPGFSDVCYSAKDSNGAWISGSLMIRDVERISEDDYGYGDGGNKGRWSAEQAIKDRLGIDVHTGAMTGEYAKRGLRMLPNSPTPELVEAVRKEGRESWRKHSVEWAGHTMAAYNERDAKAKLNGKNAMPPGPDYYEAEAILQEERERMLAARRGATAKLEQPEPLDDSALIDTLAAKLAERTGKPAEEVKGYLTAEDLAEFKAKLNKRK